MRCYTPIAITSDNKGYDFVRIDLGTLTNLFESLPAVKTLTLTTQADSGYNFIPLVFVFRYKHFVGTSLQKIQRHMCKNMYILYTKEKHLKMRKESEHISITF